MREYSDELNFDITIKNVHPFIDFLDGKSIDPYKLYDIYFIISNFYNKNSVFENDKYRAFKYEFGNKIQYFVVDKVSSNLNYYHGTYAKLLMKDSDVGAFIRVYRNENDSFKEAMLWPLQKTPSNKRVYNICTIFSIFIILAGSLQLLSLLF